MHIYFAIFYCPFSLSSAFNFIFRAIHLLLSISYDTVSFDMNFLYVSNMCLVILCRTEMKTTAASSTMVLAFISALLVFVGEVPGGLALSSATASAFLWSPHLDDEYERALFLSFFLYLPEYLVGRMCSALALKSKASSLVRFQSYVNRTLVQVYVHYDRYWTLHQYLFQKRKSKVTSKTDLSNELISTQEL